MVYFGAQMVCRISADGVVRTGSDTASTRLLIGHATGALVGFVQDVHRF
jgi:hypothetical protein